MVSFGQYLLDRREAAGLSQRELERLGGLSRNYLSLIERGERSPGLETLVALAGALGTTVADLVTDWYKLAN
jgi:transcriptional regulator with XRE-family HTH domain